MGKVPVAEHRYKLKAVPHLIGMFFFPAFCRNPVSNCESLLMSTIFRAREQVCGGEETTPVRLIEKKLLRAL